ncbi:MAG: BrnT family toxin [Desulfobacteraceae bacterium]
MEFEFDENKSRANKEKHGIDFHEAQALWDDPDRIEIPAKTIDENRFLLIGKIFQTHWSVVVTYRQRKIRIISARKARKKEVAIYES